MSNRIKNNLKNLVGQTLNQYYSKVKPTISDLRYKQEYQNRIIECMVGEVDDNYITTPETDNPIVKLEHSKEGVIKIPQIKGKTILIDAEGNETDTPGEGCRLVSVGEEEDNKLIILSKNKNLVETLYKKGISSSNGVISNSATNSFITNFIEVDNNKDYVVSGINGEQRSFVAFYDKDKNYIKRTSGTLHKNDMVIKKFDGVEDINQTSYKFPSNCKYIVFTHYSITDEQTTDSLMNTIKLQIEQGSTSTEYVEHKSNKSEILLNEPLRKIDGKVYDEINNNEIIYRTDKIIINGSEPTLGINNQDEDRISYKVAVNGLSNLPSRPCLSSHFIWSGNSDVYCRINSGYGNLYIFVPMNDELGRDTLEGFKQWLSNNPMKVIYELKEPIIEELPNSITLQGFDDTTMYIENSITPTVQYGYNALIPYKEELSNQKEEVETNTLDIENNIIPYLMDMEFNLMLMEDN